MNPYRVLVDVELSIKTKPKGHESTTPFGSEIFRATTILVTTRTLVNKSAISLSKLHTGL